MEYVMSHPRGDGKGCESGRKVLCRIEKRDPSKWHYRWIGTAPACKGEARDCTALQMTFVQRDKKGHGSACVTGWKVLCKIAQLPPLRPIPESRPNNLRILAYNIYMRPQVYLKNGQMIRAGLLPDRLREYDVLVFSEAFDEATWTKLHRGLERVGFKHRTPVLGAVNLLKKKMWNGGVAIVSKFPIEVRRERTFGSVCLDGDCNADKGVLYARINKQGRRYHVFGSHTQAWQEKRASRTIRARQFDIIRQFIDEQKIAGTEPVFIAGDLNVNRVSPAPNMVGEYDDMLARLRAGAPAYVGHTYTADPAYNELTGGTPREYLDYVLYSRRHAQPTRRSYHEVRTLRSTTQWKEFAFETYLWDLSDHYPVLGYYEF
jgi:endonuclease/exonuclease/phosphatase family metal-dependent hydrolase